MIRTVLEVIWEIFDLWFGQGNGVGVLFISFIFFCQALFPPGLQKSEKPRVSLRRFC